MYCKSSVNYVKRRAMLGSNQGLKLPFESIQYIAFLICMHF